MTGTKAGAVKAVKTNMERYGKDFYQRIGKIGGSNGNTGGFAANPELAREAGRKASNSERPRQCDDGL